MKQIWQPGKEGSQQIYAEYQRYNNPWFLAKYWLRGHYNNNMYGYTSLRYKLTDALTLTAKTQVTTWSLLRNEKFPYSATTYGREESRGDYREDRRNLFDNINQVLLQYNKTAVKDLTINALAGGEARIFNYNSDYAIHQLPERTGRLLTWLTRRTRRSRRILALTCGCCRPTTRQTSPSVNMATLTTTGRMDKLSTLAARRTIRTSIHQLR